MPDYPLGTRGGSAPEILCRQARALRQRRELRPDDTRVDVRVAPRLRRETAVGTGDHVLPPDGPREANDPLPDQLRVLHQICRVGDDAGDNRLALRQPHRLPDVVLVLVTRVGGLERVGASVDLEHDVDDVLERHVVYTRANVDAVAGVEAHAVRRNIATRLSAQRRHSAMLSAGMAL